MSSPCEWAVNIPKRKLSAHFEFIDSFKKIKNVLFIFLCGVSNICIAEAFRGLCLKGGGVTDLPAPPPRFVYLHLPYR